MEKNDSTYYAIVSYNENVPADTSRTETWHGTYPSLQAAASQASALAHEMCINDENILTGEMIKTYDSNHNLDKIYVRNEPNIRVIFRIDPIQAIIQNTQEIKNAYCI